jgi:N-acetylneuraminate synthase
MGRTVRVGERLVGDGQPAFIVAEIGINHNGDLEIAKQLVDVAKGAGCDAVKFQKRTPELCVPPEQRNVMRETPWGIMTYMDYRRRIEFDTEEYREIDRYCRERKMLWFASVWDKPSVDFVEAFQPPCYKVPSATLTQHDLLREIKRTGRPVILSTGMSSMEQIRAAVDILGTENLVLMHSTSTYPCKPEELNLRMIQTLRQEFDCPIGYSGHEVGLQTTYAAVVLGACMIERHITLDRAMWGSDQAASVEPHGFARLVRDIRVIEKALGDGIKRVYESEKVAMRRLRQVG